MYKHILIAVDGSELADRALKHGCDLAKILGARVTVVTVTPEWSSLDMAHKTRAGSRNAIGEYEVAAAAAARLILDAAAQIAKSVGTPCEIVHMSDAHPADGIVKLSKQIACDLIVMGSHGRRGIGRLMLGSQASEVLAHTPVPTLIIR